MCPETHTRINRLCRKADLKVRRRNKAKRSVAEPRRLQIAAATHHVCNVDFVADALATGRRLRCPARVDDFSYVRDCTYASRSCPSSTWRSQA